MEGAASNWVYYTNDKLQQKHQSIRDIWGGTPIDFEKVFATQGLKPCEVNRF